ITYTGGTLNTNQTYDGLGVDSGSNPLTIWSLGHYYVVTTSNSAGTSTNSAAEQRGDPARSASAAGIECFVARSDDAQVSLSCPPLRQCHPLQREVLHRQRRSV
ncbi:MAG TPA: hypothetical protein VK327_12505, partial [Candidatus Paceibacterota bacterium]|nr:hypothetical protein [Candidatus Paceibacterota bacterium]